MNKPTAIVYTSNTGHTARYAEILSQKTGLPVYNLSDTSSLHKGENIIYLGWLFASSVKGYKKADKRYNISAVVGVGLCTTGALLLEVRKAISLPEATPLFTVQGGMDKEKLKGLNKLMINALTKSIAAKKERGDGENEMLKLLQNGGDFVNEEHLEAVLNWFNS